MAKTNNVNQFIPSSLLLQLTFMVLCDTTNRCTDFTAIKGIRPELSHHYTTTHVNGPNMARTNNVNQFISSSLLLQLTFMVLSDTTNQCTDFTAIKSIRPELSHHYSFIYLSKRLADYSIVICNPCVQTLRRLTVWHNRLKETNSHTNKQTNKQTESVANL